MQPQVVEPQNKQEDKNVQAQPPQANVEVKKEEAPPIKSEENQANWKAFREQREADRKAKIEAERLAAQKAAEAEALKHAMEALIQKPSQGYQGQDGVEESDDERIQKKIEAALKKEREIIRQEQAERERQEAPQRIMQIHPDFNQVVSTENCDYIDYHYPEVTAAFKYMPDGIEKWSAMYRAIKRFVPNADNKRDAARAEKNMQKPGSVSNTAVGQTAPAGQHILSEDKRKANWERMQKAIKGVS